MPANAPARTFSCPARGLRSDRLGHAALMVLTLASCGPSTTADGSVPPPCEEDGRLEVGAGGSRLLPLPEVGGELPIVRGAQGGIHVVVGAWVRELPLEMALSYRLEDAETGEEVGEETRLALRPALFGVDGARYLRHPDLVVLNDQSPDIGSFAGRTVRLRAEAQTADERVCDTRTVTLVDPG